MSDRVVIHLDSEGVADVRLNRADKMNAIDSAMIEGILANTHQQSAWGWRDLPVPVIAAVHGVAFGGGLQIALGADIRCVSSDVKLSVMEIKWGLVPDMAGIALLRELVRGDVARELTYSGRIINGDEAVRLGLATWAGSDPLAHARAMASNIARRSPDAIRAAKRLLNRSTDADAAAILVSESREQDRLIYMEIGRASCRERV